MSTSPGISAAAATGLLDSVAAAGGNPDDLLRSMALRRSTFENAEGVIPSATFTRILNEAARITGDEAFGLHFAERFDTRDAGTLAYVVIHSPTVANAMQNIERYIRIHNEAAKVSFTIEHRLAYLRFFVSALPPESSRQHSEYTMALIVRAFRTMAGDACRPKEVRFVHAAPAAAAAHSRFFGCRVAFGHEINTLVFDRDVIERLVPAADPKLYRILKRHAERVLSELPPEADLPGRVRRAVVETMGKGAPQLAGVAERLAMSPRTLERQLKAEGTAFRDLVDDTRRRFAYDYLRSGRQTVTEIAFLLGYSEVSAFNRAFRRWTGSTPLAYRKVRH